VVAGELSFGEWLTAADAYDRWLRDQVVAVPPTLHALTTLAAGIAPDLVDRFLSIPHAHGEPARRITFRPNYICFRCARRRGRLQLIPVATLFTTRKRC
jgi:hypothetical protein